MVIFVAGEHNFWRTVVSSDYVLREVLIPLQAQVPAQTKVTVNYNQQILFMNLCVRGQIGAIRAEKHLPNL